MGEFILKGENGKNEKKPASQMPQTLGYGSSFSSRCNNAQSRSSKIINAIKKAIDEGDVQTQERYGESFTLKDDLLKEIDLKANFSFSRVFNDIQVDVYEVVNKSDSTVEVLEQLFKGDKVLAVSVLNRHVPAKGKTNVYVVRSIDPMN
jgi:hypothetical protein